jgi:cytochrome c oxidase subunit IV
MATSLPQHVNGGSSGRAVAGALVVLLLLTSTSWAVAGVNLGAWNLVVALAIAATKAGIVAFVFMELAHASTAARVVAGVTLTFILLLCLGVIADTSFR